MRFIPRLGRTLRVLSLALVTVPLYALQATAAGEVNIYSYREPRLIEPLLKAFTEKTGIKPNVIFAKAGLIERIKAEGRNSPADVILANDFGWMVLATETGVTQPVSSKALESAIPANLRDPEGHWFALTQRARVVYASKERVKQDSITYAELADPKWKGRICIRSGQHSYNVSLVASIIAHEGLEKTEAWLNGLKDNLARRPAGGDREGVRDVHAGLCDISIGNTYYMQSMLKNPEWKPWADSVRIVFPNANDRGTHVSVSGGAVALHAPHRDNAVALLEFLASPEAQHLYADINGEYPVVPGIEVPPLVKSWGELKADPLPLEKVGELRAKASELIDKVKFDQGPDT